MRTLIKFQSRRAHGKCVAWLVQNGADLTHLSYDPPRIEVESLSDEHAAKVVSMGGLVNSRHAGLCVQGSGDAARLGITPIHKAAPGGMDPKVMEQIFNPYFTTKTLHKSFTNR